MIDREVPFAVRLERLLLDAAAVAVTSSIPTPLEMSSPCGGRDGIGKGDGREDEANDDEAEFCS